MEPFEGKMAETPGFSTIYTKQQRIAEVARQAPKAALTTLAHHLDLAWLDAAFCRTRKDGAVGVDGQTAAAYAADLENNLRSLLERAKSGRYQAPPVRRVHIPKGDGSQTRPLGIPTFEDKVLQRAVVMLLEPVYEEDFLDCSYGFRPKRSAHRALDALWRSVMGMRGGWVLEIDIETFFDRLDHRLLREMLRRRVRDGVVLRLIGKWLHAGVLESGRVAHPDTGSPQGGVISPLLANVYLHEVLDTWFEGVVKQHTRGPCELIRYADDAVMVFANESDARRVLEVLPKRFGKYGLTLHPEKTRLVRFRPPSGRESREEATTAERPETFDFLGFTHYWGLSRRGNWVVKRKTAKSRFNRSLRALSQWCRTHRHLSIQEQCRVLGRKLLGHYAYYGITGNTGSIRLLLRLAERIWHKWLSRRNNRGMPWDRFRHLLAHYRLPAAVLAHPLGLT